MTSPTAPTPFAGTPEEISERMPSGAQLADQALAAITASGIAFSTSLNDRSEFGRDWWPLAIGWAQSGIVPSRPVVIMRPSSTEQVATVIKLAGELGLSVTAAAGRSGVCGGSIPLKGGISLDLTAMSGLLGLDDHSLTATFAAGTFGPELEAELASHGFTLGHWPQSMDLSTIGGWAACRGAGQFSTRYGKIEDLVLGLRVVLATGEVITTGGRGPRQAVGPDITQIFLGSEGTLGVITEVTVRITPKPTHEARRAFSFDSFSDGLDACRRILRRGATPAVLRLYDEIESERNFSISRCALIVLDEADSVILDATMAVVDHECAQATVEDVALVERWMGHRNDVSALEPLWKAGVVVDTIEVAGSWSSLDHLCEAVLGSLRAMEATVLASVHESHAYSDGACLYFTFAGRPEADTMAAREAYYIAAWDAAQHAAIAAGASLSHHHGVGIHRARFVDEALDGGLQILEKVKQALDPHHLLNPGKLGLPGSTWP